VSGSVALTGPSGHCLQVRPCGKNAAEVPLRQLDEKGGWCLGYCRESGDGERRSYVAYGNADEVVKALIAASFVPVEVACRVPHHAPPSPSVGVDAQHDLLGHGSRWEEHGGRFGEQIGYLALELLDDSTVPVTIRLRVVRDPSQEIAGSSIPVATQGTGATGAQLLDPGAIPRFAGSHFLQAM
jgi:hypothetical protein